MKAKMAVSLQVEQKLSLTPELRQSMQILQFSNYELSQYIQEQLTENPVLDLVESSGFTAEISPSAYSKPWQERIADTDETLQDFCIRQLRTLDLQDSSLRLATYIAGNLDDDGFLRITLEELSDECGAPLEFLEHALTIVQSLEPAGVGARNLRECLVLQIERNPNAPLYAKEAAQRYLDELAAGQFSEVAEQLGIKHSAVRNIYQFIRTLSPRPGLLIGQATASFVVPDASITEEEGTLVIRILDTNMPKLSLNSEYRSIMKQVGEENSRRYIEERWRTANWLIKCIEQRKKTLIRVIAAIMEAQPDFVHRGLQDLKPLTMSDIADKLRLHKSTISRAVSGKYVQTSYGTLALRVFFTSGIDNGEGKTVSAMEIKETLRKLISCENKHKPLSDQQLVEKLREHHILVSRRTVSNYREDMHILSSVMRKIR